ncbi:DUF3325 domain-containing protein [Massilia sp. YIM B04103]|uniref:DUF3325 domain-containing protein n=1 Tax=Massilia sp. YIM B04103 TaxID=2963106 RepID=UPI0021095E88|nr:DUF3325 domain-containing protein [Massilia sp. YIM B04103]
MNGMLNMAAMFAFCFTGLAALSLAMERHYADIHGRGATPPAALCRSLRMGGGLALLLAFSAALRDGSVGHGILLWLGGLTAAAVALVLLLSYKPRLTGRSVLLSAAFAMLTFLSA